MKQTIRTKHWGLALTTLPTSLRTLVVLFAMLLSSVGAWADNITISTADDWNTFASSVSSGTSYSGQTVTLGADITVSTPVGTSTYPFSGTFNGNGHTITAAITGETEAAALFSYISGATIKNLTVGGSVSGGIHCAALVGYAADGSTNQIEGVTVSAAVTTTKSHCGGIMGHGKTSTTTIKDCIFSGSISGGTHVGVLWGWSDSGCTPTIQNCLEKGTSYTGTNVNPVGLISNWGTVSDTYYLTAQKGTPNQNTTRGTKVFASIPMGYSNQTVQAADGNTYYIITPPQGLSVDNEIAIGTDGYFYVNMPTTGQSTITIPEDYPTLSFKVYDDGGKSGKFSKKSDGFLLLKAPEGYKINIKGTLICYYVQGNDMSHMYVYDGETTSATKWGPLGAGGVSYPIDLTSSGQNMLLYFWSDCVDGATRNGLDVTVTLINTAEQYAVNINNVEGGTVTSNVSEAIEGQTVTLTASAPSQDYVFTGLSVTDANNNAVSLSDEIHWYDTPKANTYTFVMPIGGVTVKPSYIKNPTAGDGIYCNMPATTEQTLVIGDAVKSFAIYSDNGKDQSYSNNCNGTLVLQAPEGYLIALRGTASGSVGTSPQTGNIISYNDYLAIYDGATTSDNIMGKFYDYNSELSLRSSSNTLRLNFISDNKSPYQSISLICTLIKADELYDVTIANQTGGTVTPSFMKAMFNDVVTLTPSTETDYLFSGLTVTDANSQPVNLSDEVWWYKPLKDYTFTMPPVGVTVTPTFTNAKTAADGLYMNMPAKSEMAVTIPQGIQSFNIYNDNGPSGIYTHQCDGTLVLTAPDGYIIHLKGTLNGGGSERLHIYDTNNTELGNFYVSYGTKSIGHLYTSGQTMKIRFQSNGDNSNNYKGPQLTAILLSTTTPNNIVTNSDHGTLSIKVEDTEATSAVYNSTVTFTVTPDKFYNVSSVTVTDANNVSLAVSRKDDGTYTFNMPATAATINATCIEDKATYWGADNDGSQDHPYLVGNADGLKLLTMMVNNGNNFSNTYFSLTADISLQSDGDASNFTAIGTETAPFSGHFNGNDHSISGIRINQPTSSYQGLFGYVSGATIEHVVVIDATILANNHIGAIAGFATQSAIIGNNMVFNSYITAQTASENNALGAIVGLPEAATLTNNFYYGCSIKNGADATATSVNIGQNKADLNDENNINGASPLFTLQVGEGISVTDSHTVSYKGQVYHIAGSSISVTYSGTLTDGEKATYTLTYGSSSDNIVEDVFAMPAADASIEKTGTKVFISYIDADGSPAGCYNYTMLQGGETSLEAGWYVAQGTLNYSSQLELNGDVYLILADGAVMTVEDNSKAIKSNQNLTIYGQSNQTGKLVATSGNDYGICSYGNLTIAGGEVNATGDGSYPYSCGLYSSGTLTITGAEVNATGTNGIYSNGTLTITSSKVNATGVTADGLYSNGNLTITGSKVTSYGYLNGINSLIGNITISGGQVTATCNYANTCIGIAVNDDRTITIGATNDDDFIDCVSFKGKVKVADGQRFVAYIDNAFCGIVSGTVSNLQTIGQKKLCPLTGYILTLPDGFTADTDHRIGTTPYYVYEKDAQAHVSGNIAQGYTLETNIPATLTMNQDYEFHATPVAWSGQGTQDDPYIIAYPSQLDLLAANVNNGTSSYEGVYFQLANDIVYTSDAAVNFTGIGDFQGNKPFKGHFNGDGHMISGIRIIKNGSWENPVDVFQGGLFNYCQDADIQGITLDNVIIDIDYGCFIGGLIARGDNTRIVDCHAGSGVSVSGREYIGGLVYLIDGADAIMKDCSIVGASIRGTIIGALGNQIENCENCIAAGVTLTAFTLYTSPQSASIGGLARVVIGHVSNNLVKGLRIVTEGNVNCSYGAISHMIRYDRVQLTNNYYDDITFNGEAKNKGIGIFKDFDDNLIGDLNNETYVDGAVPTIRDAADNTTALSLLTTIPANVDFGWGAGKYTFQLIDRTLYKDGDWNTLCLPFAVSDFTGTPLAGADVRALESSSYDNNTLTLNFSETPLTAVEAGKPYLVKWESGDNIDDPVFTGVTISGTTVNTETDAVDFVGSFSPVTLTANDKSVLFLGASNTLYYPTADNTIGSCRAYFRLKGLTAGEAAPSRMVLNFGGETTSINEALRMTDEESATATWYTIDGRKLSGKPVRKGLYIFNGRKVSIK